MISNETVSAKKLLVAMVKVPAKVSGSVAVTPKSKLDRNLVEPGDPAESPTIPRLEPEDRASDRRFLRGRMGVRKKEKKKLQEVRKRCKNPFTTAGLVRDCPSSARSTSWRWNILGPKDASLNVAESGIMRRGYQSA
jgi:hypothetical protein